jgi:hypothetical protein
MAKNKSTVPSGKAAQSICSTNKARMIEYCLLKISTKMEVLKANNNGNYHMAQFLVLCTMYKSLSHG